MTQTRSPILGPFEPHPRGRDAVKVVWHGSWDFDEVGKDTSETSVPSELAAPHPTIPVRFWGDDARGGKCWNSTVRERGP
jgi:hypothetical protein